MGRIGLIGPMVPLGPPFQSVVQIWQNRINFLGGPTAYHGEQIFITKGSDSYASGS